MITNTTPEDWKQLQERVAQILIQCGWEAQTELKIENVRTEIEIDVFAQETIEGRTYKTIIECKNWKRRVPQSTVHSFRTVMIDIGANSGFIVSKSGFQKGAYEAARNTNIKLFSFDEFQLEFQVQWYWSFFSEEILRLYDPLCSFLEPIPSMVHWDKYSTKAEIDELKLLFNAHQGLGVLISSLMPHMRLLGHGHVILPLETESRIYNNLPPSILCATSYEDLLKEIDQHASPILKRFQELKSIAIERKNKETSAQ